MQSENSLNELIAMAAKKKGITPAEYIHRALMAALEKDGFVAAGSDQTADLDAWAKKYQQETGEEISFF